MNKTCTCFLLLLPFLAIGQTRKVVPEQVPAFLNSLKNLSGVVDSAGIRTRPVSDIEVRAIARQYYRVISDNQVEFKSLLASENRSLKRKVKERQRETPQRTLGREIGIAKQMMKELFGEKAVTLAGVPYFLRVRVLDITKGEHSVRQGTLRFTKTNILCRIEEVLKGDNRFSPNESITIIFMDHWMTTGGNNCSNFFEVGKSYFAPVDARGCSQDTCSELAINLLPDEYCGVYEILDERMSAPSNYFDISPTSSWNLFKEEFVKKYMNPFVVE